MPIAQYGVSVYGEDLYGTIVPSRLLVYDFTAEAKDYGEIYLSWTPPDDPDWSEVMVVRSNVGFVLDEEEGEVVFEELRTENITDFTDAGLTGSRNYYYTLFILDDLSNSWVEVARDYAVAVTDYEGGNRLLRMIPEWLGDVDASTHTSVLARFLSIFGFQVDALRSETDTIRDLRDIGIMPAVGFAKLAIDLGLEEEPGVGSIISRRLLSNAVYLYKRKGSQIGIEAAAETLTLWGADGSYSGGDYTVKLRADRVNFVPNPSFEVNAAGWAADSNTNIVRSTDWSRYGTASLKVTTDDSVTQWGYGGSGEAFNAASPLLIDLEGWGVPRVLRLTGVAGNYASCPDSAALDIVGDIDVRARVALKDYSAATTQVVASKYNATGAQRSWRLEINSTGFVIGRTSADGSATLPMTSTAAVPVADRAALWIGWTLDVDDGAGNRVAKFYYSTAVTPPSDVTTWTQLGATVTTAGATSIFSGTARLVVGTSDDDALHCNGAIINAEVRNGINGTLVAQVRPDDMAQAGWSDPQGNPWTITRTGDAQAEVVSQHCVSGDLASYLTIPDRAELNFGATESFTYAVGMLAHRTPASIRMLLCKKATSTGTDAGWSIGQPSTGPFQARIADGAVTLAVNRTPVDGSDYAIVVRRDVAADLLRNAATGLGEGTASDTTTAALTNTRPLLIGAVSFSSNPTGALIKWAAVWRSLLSDARRDELTAWDGTVATEPSWLRAEAVFYWNADDSACRTAYTGNNVVLNLILYDLEVYMPDDVGYSVAVYGVSPYGQKSYGTVADFGPGATQGINFVFAQEYNLYQASAWLRFDVERTAILTLTWYDGLDDPIGSVFTSQTIPAATETRISVSGPSPQGTESFSLTLRIQGVQTTEDYFIDGVLMERAATLKDYFDGSFNPDLDHYWEGTEHASFSHYYYRQARRNQRLLDWLPKFMPLEVDLVLSYGDPLESA